MRAHAESQRQLSFNGTPSRQGSRNVLGPDRLQRPRTRTTTTEVPAAWPRSTRRASVPITSRSFCRGRWSCTLARTTSNPSSRALVHHRRQGSDGGSLRAGFPRVPARRGAAVEDSPRGLQGGDAPAPGQAMSGARNVASSRHVAAGDDESASGRLRNSPAISDVSDRGGTRGGSVGPGSISIDVQKQ